MQESVLQTENFQLKNEITDLKNAFDLNRDILKILSSYKYKDDPELHLLMQIITRLTTLNNQAMLNGIDYIQQKNVLKHENLQLNLEINRLQAKLQQQIQRNTLANTPNESKLLMQEQFNSLSKELMGANEERIIKEQEISFWKDKYEELLHNQGVPLPNRPPIETHQIRDKVRRRYHSNLPFKYQILSREQAAQNRRLKLYIEELQYRLLLFIKAYGLEEEVMDNKEDRGMRQPKLPVEFEQEKEEIRLLKYALNDIHVQRKEDEYILTITQRFKQKDTMNNEFFREKRSMSWPKHLPAKDQDTQIKEKPHPKMEQRYF